MFIVGQKVLYNPNIKDLPPAKERPEHIGVVHSLDTNYAMVYFPHSGYVSNFLFSGLTALEDDVELPEAKMSMDDAVRQYWEDNAMWDEHDKIMLRELEAQEDH